MKHMQTHTPDSALYGRQPWALACTLLHIAHGDLPPPSLSIFLCNALIKHAHWFWVFLPSEHISLLQTQGPVQKQAFPVYV